MNLIYGTKIFNCRTKEAGILIKVWINKYSDKDIWFATCVDKNSKLYNSELDSIQPIEDFE